MTRAKTDRGKPLIFSAPMIRRLLAGKKTQTRRPADIDLPQEDAEIVMRGDAGCSVHIPSVGYGAILECPYGGPGDRLWVREAIRLADVARGADIDNGIRGRDVAEYVADDLEVPYLDTWPWATEQLSPIFMPYGCRRIELEITRVRIERLQSITYDDAIAEGACRFDSIPCYHGATNENRTGPCPLTASGVKCNASRWSMIDPSDTGQTLGSPQSAYANFYNVLHGGPNWNLTPREEQPWNRNPFVWALDFQVHRRGE